MNKLLKYIIPVADIYAYCLLPNHFHLLLRFKDINENEHKSFMKPFSSLLNAYAKASNKRYNRRGALFLDFLKRKKVNDEKYLTKLIHYIHNNPVNHGYVNNVNDWKYSSYSSYTNLSKPSNLERTEVMRYFDTREDFINCHFSNVEYDFMDLE